MDVHSNVEDFLSYEHMEGGDGVSLEWVSTFVEDCLNGGGFTTQPLPTPTTITPTNPQTPSPIQAQCPKPISKARTKRRKTHHNFTAFHITTDPPLVPQTHWLADSELLFPKKETTTTVKVKVKVKVEEEEEERLGKDDGNGNGNGELVGGPRRCTHCLSQKTPQWRAGPLGPKTLCNACGVRFKSGRLLPEYRPAKSPTFESFKHSNSHKKVMEMRMGLSIEH